MPATKPPRSRVYPHVPAISDWPTQQTAHLLWDRIFDLEERLRASEETVKRLGDTTTQHAEDIRYAQYLAKEALASIEITPTEAVGIEAAGHKPAEAPNQFSVLEARLADGAPAGWPGASTGDPWDLTVDYGPLGRSKFIEAAVIDLHAIDVRWGHINKTGGQHGSLDTGGDGHAVDAINWKNPDGVTAEIYDVITSTGGLQWVYDVGSRDNDAALTAWKYPA